MPLSTDPSHMPARLQAAYRYWEGMAPGCIPGRQHLDPARIKDLLPWVLLVDVLTEPEDFRFRLIGTGVVMRSRRDRTGQRFSEVDGMGLGTSFWDNHAQVRDSGRPLLVQIPYVGPVDRIGGTTQLLLPLARDGRLVDMILGVVEFDQVHPLRPEHLVTLSTGKDS